MCVVSMISDHYIDKWQQLPQVAPHFNVVYESQLTAADIAAFREHVAELKLLLDRAREYDKANNEPACELEWKKEKLRELAKVWGVEIDFL